MRAYREHLWLLLVCLTIGGCAAADQVIKGSTGILERHGYITDEQKDSLDRTAIAFRKGFQDLTDEEEYYIGRSVAANILARYPMHSDRALQDYINLVGMAVVYASDRPETFAGYHFAVLASDEVNAFAAPGGLIFVTSGMLKLLSNEEQLAGILAHEVGHIAKRHGLASIKQSRLTSAFGVMAEEGARHYSPEGLQKLVTAFDGALSDVMSTLMERGYSRTQEYEADQLGTLYANRAGYEPHGIRDFLKAFKAHEPEGGGLGFYRTHPGTEERLTKVNDFIQGEGLTGRTEKVRTERFKQYIAQL